MARKKTAAVEVMDVDDPVVLDIDTMDLPAAPYPDPRSFPDDDDSGIGDLRMAIHATLPLIWVRTHEEDRLLEILRRYVIGYVNPNVEDEQLRIRGTYQLFVWSMSRGLVRIPTDQNCMIIPTTPVDGNLATMDPTTALEYIRSYDLVAEEGDDTQGAIFVLQDLPECLNSLTRRKIRDILDPIATQYKTLIISSPTMNIPLDLQKNTGVIDLKTSSKTEIDYQLRRCLHYLKCANEDEPTSKLKRRYTKSEWEAVLSATKGLTTPEIILVCSKSLSKAFCLDPAIIRASKKEAIQKDKCLEYWEVADDISQVGGMDLLKRWIRRRRVGFTEKAQAFGAKSPRGVVLLGISGCGKSLFAKAIANDWQLPLIRFDFGRVMEGLVGSSEANVRNALATVEANAPCVLWIDEIEKNAAGMGSSNNSDGGTFARVMSQFLLWLQECPAPVMVVATANSLVQRESASSLPPELTRKGRFDEVFFIDLPTKDERLEIFRIHLQKLGRDPSRFDLDALSKVCYDDGGVIGNYSGAEIEAAIGASIYTAIDRAEEANQEYTIGGDYDITVEDITTCLKESVPLSISRSSVVQSMKTWAKTNARFASSQARDEMLGKISPTTGKSRNLVKGLGSTGGSLARAARGGARETESAKPTET